MKGTMLYGLRYVRFEERPDPLSEPPPATASSERAIQPSEGDGK